MGRPLICRLITHGILFLLHDAPVYPLYLLTKLEAGRGDTTMMNYYGHILLGKRPKVSSFAVDEMKFEIRKMLRTEP